jgi:hypothetical protein
MKIHKIVTWKGGGDIMLTSAAPPCNDVVRYSINFVLALRSASLRNNFFRESDPCFRDFSPYVLEIFPPMF